MNALQTHDVGVRRLRPGFSVVRTPMGALIRGNQYFVQADTTARSERALLILLLGGVRPPVRWC
jgi:hypothetical protein